MATCKIACCSWSMRWAEWACWQRTTQFGQGDVTDFYTFKCGCIAQCILEGAENQKCLHLLCIGKIDLKRIWKMKWGDACMYRTTWISLVDVTDCYTISRSLRCRSANQFQEQLSLTPWFPDRSLLLFQRPGSAGLTIQLGNQHKFESRHEGTWRTWSDMIRHGIDIFLNFRSLDQNHLPQVRPEKRWEVQWWELMRCFDTVLHPLGFCMFLLC